MDNTIDVAGRFEESAEMTPVEFEVDRIEAIVIVGVRVGGRKVQEVPLKVAFCFPFDLGGLLPKACEQARKQWEAAQDAS